LDTADLDTVEQYLGSNWHIPAAGAGALESAAGYCLHGWWRDYRKAVEAGRLRVRGLLTAASELQVRLSEQGSFLGPDGIPNDLALLDHVRVCFVTGPNMAGKSTFLKSLAVSMLLAHAGCGVPATAMEFPVFRGLSSSVRVAESLSAGESPLIGAAHWGPASR
jgi:hypothetical protein